MGWFARRVRWANTRLRTAIRGQPLVRFAQLENIQIQQALLFAPTANRDGYPWKTEPLAKIAPQESKFIFPFFLSFIHSFIHSLFHSFLVLFLLTLCRTLDRMQEDDVMHRRTTLCRTLPLYTKHTILFRDEASNIYIQR